MSLVKENWWKEGVVQWMVNISSWLRSTPTWRLFSAPAIGPLGMMVQSAGAVAVLAIVTLTGPNGPSLTITLRRQTLVFWETGIVAGTALLQSAAKTVWETILTSASSI